MTTGQKTRRRILDKATGVLTVYRLLVPVILVVLWGLLTALVSPRVLPGPVQTLDAILAGINAGWVVSDLTVTMQPVVISFTLASFFGGVIGIALGTNEIMYDITEPFFLSFYSVPRITLYPIFLFLFGGVGIHTKIGYATFSSFFPMLIIVMGAVRAVDPVYLNVARSLRLSGRQRFRHVLLPSILIQLVVALRMTFNGAFLGVILVELFASRSGLGLILQQAMGIYNAQRIMVVIVVIVFVAFIANAAFYWAQKALERRWNMSAEDVNV